MYIIDSHISDNIINEDLLLIHTKSLLHLG